MVAEYSPEEIKKAHEVLYNEGIKMRYQVAGKEYVDRSLAAADNPFSKAMQEYVAESCWGSVWTRPGLEPKTRSLLNIAMLCCQNRGTELATHVKGALTNGASEVEIREVILQAACYCGMPAGIEGFRVAYQAIQEWKEKNGKDAKKEVHQHEGPDMDVGLDQRVSEEEIPTEEAPKKEQTPKKDEAPTMVLHQHEGPDMDLGLEQRVSEDQI